MDNNRIVLRQRHAWQLLNRAHIPVIECQHPGCDAAVVCPTRHTTFAALLPVTPALYTRIGAKGGLVDTITVSQRSLRDITGVADMRTNPQQQRHGISGHDHDWQLECVPGHDIDVRCCGCRMSISHAYQVHGSLPHNLVIQPIPVTAYLTISDDVALLSRTENVAFDDRYQHGVALV